MKNKKKIYFEFLYCFSILLFMTRRVDAYVDPSIMTYAIQAVAGIMITLGTFFGLYWRKVRNYFVKKFNIDLNSNRVMETDHFTFRDPDTGKVIESRGLVTGTKTSGETEPAQKGLKHVLKELTPSAILSFAFAFMLGLFAPLEIYMTNTNDLWFDTTVLIPRILVVFVALIVAGILLYAFSYLLYSKFYYVMLVFGTALLLCTYIQGNFMTSTLPIIDGADIVWAHYHKEMFYSALALGIIIVLLVLAVRFLGEKTIPLITSGVSILVTLLLVATLAVITVSSDGFKKKDYYNITAKNEFLMSTDENYVIFLLDCVDASYFSEVLGYDPEYKEIFKDFTYYSNTMSTYSYTRHSIPYILGGEWIYDNEPSRDYNQRMVDGSPILKDLEGKGYSLGLYEVDINLSKIDSSRFDNITRSAPRAKNNRQFIKNIVKFVWFKYAPYYLKPLAKIDIDMFTNLQDTSTIENDEIFQSYDIPFFAQMNKMEASTTQQKQFKFIHIEGAHSPYRYSKEVVEIPRSEGSYQKNIECAITIAKTYLEKLKNNGTYDNSVIVIMSDHGYNTTINKEINKPESFGRQNPILLIKGKGETHSKFMESSIPVSYVDLQDAFINLANGNMSNELFDYKENEQRDRLYYYSNLYIDEYFTEQIYHGHASDEENMEDTGKLIKINR